MTSNEAQRRLDFMLEFRANLQDFLQAKRELAELTGYAERDWMMMHFDQQAVKEKGEDIIHRYQEARTKVARHIVEATQITDDCDVPSQIQILPPPMIGGYGRRYNIYQAAIEKELPFNYELQIQSVADVVDQTIFACERIVASEPSPVKDVLQKARRHIGSVFSWFFPSQLQRTIFGWIVIVSFLCLLLRYIFGFHFEDLGKLVTKWVFK